MSFSEDPNVEALTNNKRKTIYEGEIHKCPNCREMLKAFNIACPACKFELRGTKSSSAVKDLAEKLEQATTEKQEITIIKNFPIPNTKEDIFEFMLLASSNFDANYYAAHLYEEDISDAWLSKIEQCYQKAHLIFSEQSDIDKIDTMHSKIISNCEAKEKEEKKRKRKQIKKSSRSKGSVSMLIIALAIFLCVVLIPWDSIFCAFNPDPNTIKIGVSHEDCEGQYYKDIVNLLESKGFTNIEAREDGWNLLHKSETVKKVTIDGKESFAANSRFPKDVKVIIFYYK